MKKQFIARSAVAFATLALGIALGAFYVAPLVQPRAEGAAETADPDFATERGGAPSEREILYWVAPMDPNFRRDEPGKSPMGMDLVPVYADEAAGEDGVSVSAAVENSLGVRTAEATVRPLWRRIETTGYVTFDETRITAATPWTCA